MQQQMDDQQEEIYACDIAMKEIPISEMASDEAKDYVLHYFGAECYAQWQKQAASAKE